MLALNELWYLNYASRILAISGFDQAGFWLAANTAGVSACFCSGVRQLGWWLEYSSGGSIICPEGGSLECSPAPMLTLQHFLSFNSSNSRLSAHNSLSQRDRLWYKMTEHASAWGRILKPSYVTEARVWLHWIHTDLARHKAANATNLPCGAVGWHPQTVVWGLFWPADKNPCE